MVTWIISYCNKCDGSGLHSIIPDKLCNICNGYGYYPKIQEYIFNIPIPGVLNLTFKSKKEAYKYIEINS